MKKPARLPGRSHVAVALLTLTAATIPADAKTVQVTINDLVFSPAEIHAVVGDTIEWINKDALKHTATAKGHWDVPIPAGATASVRLKTPGSVDYLCRIHPTMTGRIVVAPK